MDGLHDLREAIAEFAVPDLIVVTHPAERGTVEDALHGFPRVHVRDHTLVDRGIAYVVVPPRLDGEVIEFAWDHGDSWYDISFRERMLQSLRDDIDRRLRERPTSFANISSTA